MAVLSAHGIGVTLPPGWDAHVYRRPEGEVSTLSETVPPAATYAVVHAASFPLPPERGDYGGGAVEMMRAGDVMVALVEHGPDAAGSELFAAAGPPRQLSTADFAPDGLLRALPGQRGTQAFFSAGGRAFCLYVVIAGDEPERLVTAVNSVLGGLRIGPA